MLWKYREIIIILLGILPLVLKFTLGLDLIWINIELILGLRHSLQMAKNTPQAKPFPKKCVAKGRVVLACTIISFLLLIVCFSIIVDIKLDEKQRIALMNKQLTDLIIVM